MIPLTHIAILALSRYQLLEAYRRHVDFSTKFEEEFRRDVPWALVHACEIPPMGVMSMSCELREPSFRAHYASFVQDCVLDKFLREELIDMSNRLEDRYMVRCSGAVIGKETLHEQIQHFEYLGFLHLTGILYETSEGRILMNQKWIDEYTFNPFCRVFTEAEAEMHKLLRIPPELESRIGNHDFLLSNKDKAEVFIVNSGDFISILDKIYSATLSCTKEIISGDFKF